ncbi:class I SAM-dependent DNA methyltransferase [Halorhodospira halophila]|uniref:class I SAM-dependent DNA methyltransferase n=1 Tax=Halorhodospira halophila TaxID=1053 RepID=UPI001914A279|nr:class I SAM-dependent DNA methyltransferase [Halorhodospira halophila]MBK5943308.1 SAM-dependent methyltransferase [Halorhodospira halophila]
MAEQAVDTEHPVEQFISRWSGVAGTEQANSQLFLTELCDALELPKPDPAGDQAEENEYVFERRLHEHGPDGSVHNRRADLYRRGCFVLESKKIRAGENTTGWDKALKRAFEQAQGYVRALPAWEGRPPFILVVDVGQVIECYSEFSRSGGNYVPYPSPAQHRIRLEDLRDSEVRERLRLVWLDPDALDLSKRAARVTRQISDDLAKLARSLEQGGYEVERVSRFLMRAMFTMFAEDIGLIPHGRYQEMLREVRQDPEVFPDAMRALWERMRDGGFESRWLVRIPQFNGGLFDEINPIPLNTEQLDLLINAASHDWTEVEPAIFGTLLERALDPKERHKLGAHYTPRPYVERLVLPTVVEPLREEWADAQAQAAMLLAQGKEKEAREAVERFFGRLLETRVLDPACGSGNFLYVAMEHLKRLEGEVLELLSELRGGQTGFDAEGMTVDPHQFLGLEINPWAAHIAEMVLWIGYVQWHYRIHGRVDNLPEPILRRFHNIEHRDALIEYDDVEPLLNEHGEPVTIWDGTTKPSPVTGEPIPDEAYRAQVYHYINPRRAEWPQADFVVGNPPFIGSKRMRAALGDGYVDAIRSAWGGEVPDSADLVMYWWHIAAKYVKSGQVFRFGFVATNSLRQTFNRHVIANHVSSDPPLSLVFAIPDHPWVDSADGAAVRISLTVAQSGKSQGALQMVTKESHPDGGIPRVEVSSSQGLLNSNLTVGADVGSAFPLASNRRVTSNGFALHGAGFIVTPDQAEELGLGCDPEIAKRIHPYRNGRDIMQTPRGVMVIDLFGLSQEDARYRVPALYQWVRDRVKPERDQNRRKSIRENWWVFGWPRPEWRKISSGVERYIATVETVKHRIFTFLDQSIVPDHMLVNIGVEDAFYLGVLSSRVHAAWALAAGGTLEDRPRYNKTRCFETFPFPAPDHTLEHRIAVLGERLDAQRAERQARDPGLTLTGMYNVLEKIRAGEKLTKKERTVHEQGLISVLAELHDELDRAVFEAYGWEDLADVLVGRPGATTPLQNKPEDQEQAEQDLLQRLIDLNAERAAEEARGHVRWLRPEFQAPDEAGDQTSESSEHEAEQTELAAVSTTAETAGKKPTFPKNTGDRIRAVRQALSEGPQTTASIAARYTHRPSKAVQAALEALEAIGMASHEGELWWET